MQGIEAGAVKVAMISEILSLVHTCSCKFVYELHVGSHVANSVSLIGGSVLYAETACRFILLLFACIRDGG